VNESDIAAGAYKQLVGGVLWLVRNGSRYVDESKLTECPDVQETGKYATFRILGFSTACIVVVPSVEYILY
jgi:hypothetical protein